MHLSGEKNDKGRDPLPRGFWILPVMKTTGVEPRLMLNATGTSTLEALKLALGTNSEKAMMMGPF